MRGSSRSSVSVSWGTLTKPPTRTDCTVRTGGFRHGGRTIVPLARTVTKLATACAVVASLLVVLPSRPVAAVGGQLLFSETFANGTTSAPGSAVSITSGLPCLTAGADTSATPVAGCGLDTGADSPGSGALRLTSDVVNQASGVLYNTNLPLSQGLSITFDEYQYGGTGADGISFDL